MVRYRSLKLQNFENQIPDSGRPQIFNIKIALTPPLIVISLKFGMLSTLWVHRRHVGMKYTYHGILGGGLSKNFKSINRYHSAKII